MASDDLAAWFDQQLQASTAGFIWAVEQVPPERRSRRPPNLWGLGEWTVLRHMFHLIVYEETMALPSMRQWLGDPMPAVEEGDEDIAWGAGHELDSLLVRLNAVRAAQRALLPHFDREQWEEGRAAIWGTVSLHWVMSKTYQHAAEHTSDVLKIGLFWDFALRRLEAAEA